MMRPSPNVPPAIYLLADHLDAVLAAGEDLQALEAIVEPFARSDGAEAPWSRLRGLISKAQMYEMTLVARALQARARAAELTREPGQLGMLLELFVAGTAIFADAVSDLADRIGADFDASFDPLAYLRTRGLVPADAGSLSGVRKIKVGDQFLVARRIELGPLLDTAGALLDLLEANYCLFPDVLVPDTLAILTPGEREAEGASQYLEPR